MTAAGRRGGGRLSTQDIELWEGVTRSVRPLRKRVVRPAPPVEAKPRPPADAAKPRAPEQAPKPKAAPAVLERRLKQKIARGQKAIEAKLDLHGHTQEEAHAALYRFLRKAQARDQRLVLVITGKGASKAGGRGEGVLRRAVPLWLSLPELRAIVVGFDAAAPAHGGEGALYVRVRKAR